jgi:CubicO group peptidase (beta-lactamase class C family)
MLRLAAMMRSIRYTLPTWLRLIAASTALALVATACGGEGLPEGGEEEELDEVSEAVTNGATRIDCGSTTAVGSFLADDDFSGGTQSSRNNAIDMSGVSKLNPAPAAVYQSSRFGNFTYTMPGFALGKSNLIRLHFAETFWTAAGKRKFNVSINGKQVLKDFDIFVAAGGANKALIQEFTAMPDASGKYVIQFTNVLDNSFVAGIEVQPTNAPQSTQIHAGGLATGAFADDVGFSGGSTRTRTNTITTSGVVHAAPASLYQSQRFGNFSYTVPGFTPNSTNTVRLHFAETHWTAAGLRKFNVKINGQQVLTNFDIFAAAGANKAVVREFRAPADANGKYTIEFSTVIDAATVSGIEVLPSVPWFMRQAMTSSQYQQEFDARIANGYRLTYVDGTTVNGTTLFSAIWDLSPGPAFVARHNLSPADLQTQDDAMKAAGFHITSLNGYAAGSSELYAAIWEAGSISTRFIHFGMTSAQYQADFNTQLAANLKLVHVSGFESGGVDKYAAIWDVRPDPAAWSARHNLDALGLITAIGSATSSGQSIVDLDSYNVGGQQRFAVIFDTNAKKPLKLALHESRTDFQQSQVDLYRQGYAPLTVVGSAPSSGSEGYTAIWRNVAFTQAELDAIDAEADKVMNPPPATPPTPKAPSVSLAITQNGRLVFAKAWGKADPGGSTLATTKSRYRIMSISKSITGAAIMKLVDMGRLNLDAKVFGTNGILGDTYGPYAAGWTSITVRQLLSHSAGLCPPNGAACPVEAPIFDTTKLSKTAQELIKLATVNPLSPTGDYEYSNMGYVILGRVIEKLVEKDTTTPQTYTQWVNANVLQPSGISGMQLAQSTLAGRAVDEVVYTPNAAYTDYNVPRMDAHGGWLATATDLLRFTTRVDGLQTTPDVLSPISVFRLFDPVVATNPTLQPINVSGYALGWFIQPPIMWHNGSLSGTSTFLVRRDPFVFAALTNTNGVNMFPVGDNLVTKSPAINWPTTDFFLEQ